MAISEHQKPTSEDVRIKGIFKYDNIDFWLVSGNRVHSTFNKSWKNDKKEGEFIGGHHYVFDFIPDNEIWISDLDKETGCTMVHEYIERLLMKENGLKYGESHRVATAMEDMYKSMGYKCE